MTAIPMLTDDDVRAAATAAEEAGFGALRTDANVALPLAEMNVAARIRGLVAETTVRQVFVQSGREPVEATYVFPLPDRAAVTSFRLEVAGRVVVGEIQERGAARERYAQAIVAGKRAAIAEEERAGVFTVRAGNLMPGDRAVVTLELVGPLAWIDGEVTYRFPLVVAPRYVPGAPLPGESVGDGTALDTDAVPDASRITPPVLLPGFPSAVRLSLSVEVDAAGLPLSGLRSSLHAITEESSGDVRRVRVQPGERLNRDFLLRFTLGDAKTTTSTLVVEPDAAGEEGTFVLMIVPPSTLAAAARPRDVVFVLDRSGSMAGWKMVCARRAVARMIDTLGPRDRFQVLAFDSAVETPAGLASTALADATDRLRFRAVEWLSAVDARGGTEMAQPLALAADLVGTGYTDRERTVVLVTDGQVGNEDQIVALLAPKLRGARVFALGVDTAVNAAFLERLGALGGGFSEVVESEDRLDDVMERVHRRLGSPVLRELAVVPDGLSLLPGTQTPARVPDVFAGAPVLVAGRLRGDATRAAFSVRASGADGTTFKDVVHARALPSGCGRTRVLASIWARAQVRALEDELAIGRGDAAALERRLVETSVRFGVLSRFTAFVAVDERVVNAGGDVERIVQPVELPAGWDGPAVEASRGAQPRYAMAGAAPPPPGMPPPGGPPQARRPSALGATAMSPPMQSPAPQVRAQVMHSHHRSAPPPLAQPAVPPSVSRAVAQAARPPATLNAPPELVARAKALREHLATAPVTDATLDEASALLAAIAPLAPVHEMSAVARLRNELDAIRELTTKDATLVEELFERINALVTRLFGLTPPDPARKRAFWKR